jgi:hypothetical protein
MLACYKFICQLDVLYGVSHKFQLIEEPGYFPEYHKFKQGTVVAKSCKEVEDHNRNLKHRRSSSMKMVQLKLLGLYSAELHTKGEGEVYVVRGTRCERDKF